MKKFFFLFFFFNLINIRALWRILELPRCITKKLLSGFMCTMLWVVFPMEIFSRCKPCLYSNRSQVYRCRNQQEWHHQWNAHYQRHWLLHIPKPLHLDTQEFFLPCDTKILNCNSSGKITLSQKSNFFEGDICLQLISLIEVLLRAAPP